MVREQSKKLLTAKQTEKLDEEDNQALLARNNSTENDQRGEVDGTAAAEPRPSAQLPWWRSVGSRLSRPMRRSKDTDVLRGYILTLIRSCLRPSWNAEKLRESYELNPSSIRGSAFLAVSSSLLIMHRARHMGQCRTMWHTQLLQELLQRRELEWTAIETDPCFQHFLGCEACLAHRPATRCLRLKGVKYDSSDFWPMSCRLDILASTEADGALTLAVELAPGSRPGQPTIGDEGEVEFWVDEQCLRKCLVFHELVHSTSILTEEVMCLVEDELQDGVVSVRKAQQLPEEGTSLVDLVQCHLVDVLCRNKHFLEKQIQHFADMTHIGEAYFSAVDEGIPGSHQEPKDAETNSSARVYDAPLSLRHEQYAGRMKTLESLTEIKKPSTSFPPRS